MNNKLKIALGLIAGGAVAFLSMKRKKNGKPKMFTAPDGNTYGENQIYRTFDNKVYKNGKEIHFNTPELGQNAQSAMHHSDEAYENSSKNYQAINKNVNYHQKGNRHH